MDFSNKCYLILKLDLCQSMLFYKYINRQNTFSFFLLYIVIHVECFLALCRMHCYTGQTIGSHYCLHCSTILSYTFPALDRISQHAVQYTGSDANHTFGYKDLKHQARAKLSAKVPLAWMKRISFCDLLL